MDYVTVWYRKAADYGRGKNVRFAFVSTNSVTQGEQPARLWNDLFAQGWRIDFGAQDISVDVRRSR